MILLENANRILEAAIQQRFDAEKREAIDVTFADFDGVLFRVSTLEAKNIINISIQFRGASEVVNNLGGKELLAKYYGPLFQSTPEAGYDATVQIDLDNLPAQKTNLPNQLAHLKRHLYAAPFQRAIEKKGSGEIIVFPYRPEENVYIKPDADRVTVIFDIQFHDADDIVFSRVFLQEFADARRTIGQAPAVSFSQKEPPLELKGVKGVKAGENNGFVSFVLFGHHINEQNRDRTMDLIQTFRDYLHYHIKCSKAYMHMRMRTRVDSLLQILNRARPEPVDVVKKTATGKTFKRAGNA